MSIYNYRTLCEIRIRHAYLLDNGLDDFDGMNDKDKAEALARYDFTEAVDIVPTAATTAALKGRHVLVSRTNEGIELRAKALGADAHPVTGIEQDLVLVFALKIRHPRFAYFTDLTFDPNRILLFANVQPAELATTVPLIPRLTEAIRADDAYLLSAADTDEILKKRFRDEDRYGLLGLVYLRVNGSTTHYSLLNVTGETKVSPVQFKIHFNTTSTHWKFIRESAGFIAETTDALPLTRHGFIEIDPATAFTQAPPAAALDYSYPNPLLETFEITPAKTYSVIFI